MNISKFHQVYVNTYSQEVWEKYIAHPGAYGFYSFSDGNIHMPEKGIYPQVDWNTVLLHEYVHFLQHWKGKGLKLIPLGLKVDIPERVKQLYPPPEWETEAEAYYLQEHPEVLGEIEKEVLGMELPCR